MFNSTSKKIVYSTVGCAALVILFAAQTSWACGPGAEDCSQDRPADKKEQSVVMRSVDPSYVCMTNDTAMKKPQIPIMINGKTYYGCCNGCVARLKEDAASRHSSDPATGRSVDKASAYIVKDAAGKALYFESIESYKAYLTSSHK